MSDRDNNLIHAVKYFYREYTVHNLIFTVIGLYFIIFYGMVSFIYVFWIKCFGYLVLAILYLISRKKHLYFFHNLGVGTIQLFALSIVFDMLMALSLYTIIYLIL